MGFLEGPLDFSVDFGDEDGNGMADLQLIIDNGDSTIRNRWDWASNIIWLIDDGEQGDSFAYMN